MIKRIASLVACVGIVFSSGGCSVLQALKVDPATINAVQQIAVTTCDFLPTVETIANIITGGMSAIPATVANAICAAVAANKAPGGMQVGRVGAAAPPSAKVGNTKVEGIFVR